MLSVYRERCDSKLNLARFYEVDVQQTLFGDWAVVCHWGRIGTQGRLQQDWFPPSGTPNPRRLTAWPVSAGGAILTDGPSRLFLTT